MKAWPKIAILLLVLVGVMFIAVVVRYTSSANSIAIRATAESLLANPIPKPDFIIGTEFDTSEQGDRSCIFIYQGALWESGDSAEELTSHLVSNTQLSIDGTMITNVAISESGMIPEDSSGNLTSDFGSTLQFCYGFHIGSGLHLAILTTSSLSGETYSHSWTIAKP